LTKQGTRKSRLPHTLYKSFFVNATIKQDEVNTKSSLFLSVFLQTILLEEVCTLKVILFKINRNISTVLIHKIFIFKRNNTIILNKAKTSLFN